MAGMEFAQCPSNALKDLIVLFMTSQYAKRPQGTKKTLRYSYRSPQWAIT